VPAGGIEALLFAPEILPGSKLDGLPLFGIKPIEDVSG
jgi:hypothetical protein